MILIPIVYPEALPKQTLAKLLVAPRPPAAVPRAAVVKATSAQMMPSVIPVQPITVHAPLTRFSGQRDVASDQSPVGMAISDITGGGGAGVPGGFIAEIVNRPLPNVQISSQKKTIVVSSGVAAVNLIGRIQPVYPPIAIAARIQGTVVVQATISRTGIIENARAISGPEMLRRAAVQGVRSARYKPCLLNGEPVEVETTVNVIFSLGG
jgi:protein TonB